MFLVGNSYVEDQDACLLALHALRKIAEIGSHTRAELEKQQEEKDEGSSSSSSSTTGPSPSSSSSSSSSSSKK